MTSSIQIHKQCNPLPTAYEQQFVVDTYNEIAEYFAITRGYLWDCVKIVIDQLVTNAIVVEVGCGNGKNLKALQTRQDVVAIGCDITPYFVQTSKTSRIDTFQATNMALPVRSGVADLVMSIAVLHHFETESRRLQALEELLRIVCPGGYIVIQVWAKEQPLKSKRTFQEGDNLVGWHNPDKSMYRERFYHVFSEGELEHLLAQSPLAVSEFISVKSWYEIGNWVIYLQRKS